MRADPASEGGRLEFQPPPDAAPVSRSSPIWIAAALALSAATFAALMVDGGFGDGSRLAFTGLAGFALVLASGSDPTAAARAARSVPVVALTGLAALTALSALWSPAEPADVLLWAMVVGGYAAVVVAAATLVSGRPAAARWIAVGLVMSAAACGLWGVTAAAVGDSPAALRIGGGWRPAGPFEYPPALAILMASALPAAIVWMARGRAAVAVANAGVAGVAGAVVALTHSRLALALAIVFVAATVVAGRSETERWLRAGAALLVVVVGVVAGAIAGGIRSGGPQGSGYLLGLFAAIGGGMAIWAAVRARWPAPGEPERPGARRGRRGSFVRSGWWTVGAAGAVVALAVLAVALGSDREGAGIQPSSGFDHGRGEQWSAAIDVGVSDPLLGAGGESYFLATSEKQGDSPTLYAHSLPLEAFAELGVPGLLLAIVILGGSCIAVWRTRSTAACLLLGPFVVAFAIANLVDWSWHLAGSAAIWALALGALLGVGFGERT